MQSSGGHRGPTVGINIIPFIDICLVLLVVFMVVSAFAIDSGRCIEQSLVDLPQGSQEEAVPETEQHYVRVSFQCPDVDAGPPPPCTRDVVRVRLSRGDSPTSADETLVDYAEPPQSMAAATRMVEEWWSAHPDVLDKLRETTEPPLQFDVSEHAPFNSVYHVLSALQTRGVARVAMRGLGVANQ